MLADWAGPRQDFSGGLFRSLSGRWQGAGHGILLFSILQRKSSIVRHPVFWLKSLFSPSHIKRMRQVENF